MGVLPLTLTKSITDILNGTIESVKSVIPTELSIDKPSLITQPFQQQSMGVLIGMTGDFKGRVLIDGDVGVYGKIGEMMFGMPLQGEMLESFAGELGNMIAGNLSTSISKRGVKMDITPPTVFVGNTKISGFNNGFRLPVRMQNIGFLDIVLMVEAS